MTALPTFTVPPIFGALVTTAAGPAAVLRVNGALAAGRSDLVVLRQRDGLGIVEQGTARLSKPMA